MRHTQLTAYVELLYSYNKRKQFSIIVIAHEDLQYKIIQGSNTWIIQRYIDYLNYEYKKHSFDVVLVSQINIFVAMKCCDALL